MKTRYGMLTKTFMMLILAVSAVFGAYLESDQKAPSTRPPEMVRPIPAPHRDNPVTALVQRLEAGTPTSYRNLTIYPLLAGGPSSRRSFGVGGSSGHRDVRALDDALSRDWITIREKDNAEVSRLLVRNDSRHYIFFMAGEIITGGKQNRIIKSDVLLAPHSEWTSIPVYCGEQQRWTNSRKEFQSGRHLAAEGIRKMAASSATQDSIWREIDGKMAEAEVSSATRNYQSMYEDKKIRKELDKCVSHFRRFCGSRTVGAVVVSGGRIRSCDLFSNEDLLSSLWDKICRSYAVDVVLKSSEMEPAHPRAAVVGPAQIRVFLDNVLTARFEGRQTPGEGGAMSISGRVDGNALTWDKELVHAALFPAVTIYRNDSPVKEHYGTEDRLWR